MTENLTFAENRLALAIVDWLKREVSIRLDEYPGPGLLYDMAQSNFEEACAALERAAQVCREGGSWRILWDETIETRLPDCFDRPALDQLLDAMICHWNFLAPLKNGPIFETETPARLETGDLLKNVSHRLSTCGYAVASDGGKFTWTDRAAPWLVRHGIWDLFRFDPSSDEVIDQVIPKIAQQPLDWLSGPNGSFQPAFARRLFASWFDGEWHASVWREYPSDDWDLPLATGLYLRLQ